MIITISYLIISCFNFLHENETDLLIRHMSKTELYPAKDLIITGNITKTKFYR